jgi:hypothetical protein
MPFLTTNLGYEFIGASRGKTPHGRAVQILAAFACHCAPQELAGHCCSRGRKLAPPVASSCDRTLGSSPNVNPISELPPSARRRALLGASEVECL